MDITSTRCYACLSTPEDLQSKNFSILKTAAHHNVVFAFPQILKRTGGTVKPLHLRAPVAVFVGLVAPVTGELQAFFVTVRDCILMNCKFPDSHIFTSGLRPYNTYPLEQSI